MTSVDTGDLVAFEFDTPLQTLRGWTAGPRSAKARRHPILFVHPINLQGSSWGRVASALCADRFCLLPDLRGHGRSTSHPPFGVDAWVEDLLAVLDHFEVPRCHLVGGSLGGTLAVSLAERAPERVLSIVGFGTTLAIEGEDLESVLDVLAEKGVRRMFEEVIPAISVAPNTPQPLIDEIVAATNPNDVPTVAAVWRATIETDVRHLAGRVRAPAMIVSGEHDLTCPPEQGRAMAQALSAPFVRMPAVGHLPMYEAPDQTADMIRMHVEGQEAEEAEAS